MKKVVKICIISFVILLSLISLFLLLKKDIIFNLIGEENVELEVYSEYYDLGVESKIGNKIFGYNNLEYSVNTNLDNTILGDYEYTYKLENKNLNLTRKIKVVDKTKPEIIVSSEEIVTCPNKLEGFTYTANDNYDKDLTDKIVKKIENNVLYLEVTDSSGNITKKEVPIKYEDKNKPKITLSGKTNMTVLIGKYEEPGYSASDECYGNLSSSVKVSGEVNKDVAGTYKIIYSVTDPSGNSTSVTRTVNIVDKIETKIVYLTFDDGPGAYTEKLLNILKKYNVKATFFVTAQFSKYTYLIGREYEEGHSVGIHTYSHKWSSVYGGIDNFKNDFNSINELIKSKTNGYETKIYRFPGGSSNTVSIKHSVGVVTEIEKYITENGYKYFDWNVSSNDATGKTISSKQTYLNVINGINNKDGYSIVLMHDIKKNTVNAVEDIIKYGLNNGYEFKALDINSPTYHFTIKN